MKIGLDVHGVIDEAPEFVKLITKLLYKEHEIHVITGLTKEDFLKIPEVDGIYYTHFYSITDDLLSKTKHKIDIHGRPRFEEYDWNTAKAEYCRKNEIDIMFDDSEVYGNYFWTPYFQLRRIQ